MEAKGITEEIRKEIARKLHQLIVWFALQHGEEIPPQAWEELRESAKEHYLSQANQILRFLKPYLKIAIEKELPKPNIDIHIWRDYSPDMAYEACQNDMLKWISESFADLEEVEDSND